MMRLASAEVVKVIDGDTFHGRLNIGWGIVLEPRSSAEPGLGTVRVLFPDGRPYDAPETSTAFGKEARDVARGLVPVGLIVEVASFKLDAFGRTLGAVTLPDGRDWATTMTALGYVKGSV